MKILISLNSNFDEDVRFYNVCPHTFFAQQVFLMSRKSKYMKKISKGLGVSSGIALGKVKIIKSMKRFPEFNEGDILVAKITDPTMVMLMSKAGAIICDIGGMTSHPSIVSREMGIPCVVATKNATKVLKDGMQVRVDGTKGIIYSI